MNNSIVEVIGITEEENSVSATFQTMEGHIENGVINFTLQSTGEDSYSFTITSLSEVDMALVPEKLARNEQMKSWIEVLNNIVKMSGGEEVERATPE